MHISAVPHPFTTPSHARSHPPNHPPQKKQVWIAQRETLAAPDSLSGFALACLAAYLLQERRLNLRCAFVLFVLVFNLLIVHTHRSKKREHTTTNHPKYTQNSMDALPALMVTLKFLADASLLATGDNPLLLQGKSTVDLTAYTGAFPCALIVGDTGCNALGGLSRAAAEEVHREARAALALLQSNVRVVGVCVCKGVCVDARVHPLVILTTPPISQQPKNETTKTGPRRLPSAVFDAPPLLPRLRFLRAAAAGLRRETGRQWRRPRGDGDGQGRGGLSRVF